MFFKGLKTSLLSFLMLIPMVILLQYVILEPHLRYGFADVDWNFLLSYKKLSQTYHNPVSFFWGAWNYWGVYTYQVYYIGLIQKFFGMDYINFQIVTHVFKVIATLSLYPIIFLTTKSRLAAFLTALIYGVSYSSVGVMYTVVTSGLFVAIPIMNAFLVWYWYLINKVNNSIWEILFQVIIFAITLLSATERMYPLIVVVILIEFYWWFRKGYSKLALFQALKRQSIFLALFLMILLYKPSIFRDMSGNVAVTYQKFLQGNWQVVLSPIISLGSLFLPRDYWNYLGVANINNVYSYIGFLMNGPFLLFGPIAIFLSIFISKNKRVFIFSVLLLTFILSILVYVLSTHQLYISESVRMHFDMTTIIPALIGNFVIALVIVLFREWIKGDEKNSLVISMIGGMVIAFVFIILTWVAADWTLVFSGVHRYLTIPAIGSSLFIAGFITIIFNKLQLRKTTKGLAYLFLLVLIPIILFNASVIKKYFNYELSYAGTDVAGHIRMKSKLWSYLGDISKTDPSIFYFDESADHDNGYFDETTVMAGFNSWMRFRGSDIVPDNLTPGLLRSNLMCPGERIMCLDKVKGFISTQNREKGILYGTVFYKKENFYAFRFINKDIVDIRSGIVKTIGLE